MLICLPFAVREIDRARQLLEWILELEGRVIEGHSLMLLSAYPVVAADWGEMHNLGKLAFPKVRSFHQRSYAESKWPRDANLMFRAANDWIESNHDGPWLWLETDMAPLKTGWLDTLAAEYRKARKPFMGTLFKHPKPHLNGGMIYPSNVAAFNLAMLHAETLPWDLTLPELTIKHGHNTPLIQRMLSNPAKNEPMTFPNQDSLKAIRPEVVLFHGCKDGTLIERLREQRSGVPAPVTAPASRRRPIRALLAWFKPSNGQGDVGKHRSLFHAVERHGVPDERKMRALKSWDKLYFQGVVPCHLWRYPRTAREIGDTRDLPYLKDVLEFAMKQAGDDDVIFWTNDDNWLHPELSDILLKHVALHGPCSCKRFHSDKPIDGPVLAPSEYATDATLHMGRDLFAATKSWFVENWDKIPDFILGASDWDLGLASMIRLFHGVQSTYENFFEVLHPCEIQNGYVGHEAHISGWSTQIFSPSSKRNRLLWKEWARLNNVTSIKFKYGTNMLCHSNENPL